MRVVSNDSVEGEVGPGSDGWHIDGYMDEYPFLINAMHHMECSEGGATFISPLKELVESLEPEVRAYWEDLYFLTGDSVGNLFFHPLIYPHPITGEPTMVFHLGQYKCWGLYRSEELKKPVDERLMIDIDEMLRILNDLSRRLSDPSRKLEMNWRRATLASLITEL